MAQTVCAEESSTFRAAVHKKEHLDVVLSSAAKLLSQA